MDIHNYSLPELYMRHYFKYLLLRYHSLVHFIQSKSYSIRLFKKTFTFTNNLILCNIGYKFASFAAQIRDFSLSMTTFRNLPKNLGPDMNIFLENHALFGDCLFKVFLWKCNKRCQLYQVTFTTSVS